MVALLSCLLTAVCSGISEIQGLGTRNDRLPKPNRRGAVFVHSSPALSPPALLWTQSQRSPLCTLAGHAQRFRDARRSRRSVSAQRRVAGGLQSHIRPLDADHI